MVKKVSNIGEQEKFIEYLEEVIDAVKDETHTVIEYETNVQVLQGMIRIRFIVKEVV